MHVASSVVGGCWKEITAPVLDAAFRHMALQCALHCCSCRCTATSWLESFVCTVLTKHAEAIEVRVHQLTASRWPRGSGGKGPAAAAAVSAAACRIVL
jgi:hypothetical protein